jgi:hypothetical protein
MPRYKNIDTLKKKNIGIYYQCIDINRLYTKHVLNKEPIGAGIVIFKGVEFGLGGLHYFFAMEIKNGTFNSDFKQRGKGKRTYKKATIKTLRKIINMGRMNNAKR